MAAHRAPSTRHFRIPGRRAAVALAVGAGVVLAPMPAMASTGTAVPTSVVAPTHTSQVAVNTALSELGRPYAWGAAGPGSFDCSGLALYAYKAAGVSLPHSTGLQSRMGAPVSRSALQPGDLVFFYGGGHVGIYIGGNEVVHAPTAGDVVKVTSMNYMPFSSARRIG